MGLETRIPSIPDTDLFPERALRAIRETHEVREGRRGDPLDAFISIRDLKTLIVQDTAIVALLNAGHTHDGATLEFDGVNANGSSHNYRTTAAFQIYSPSLQVQDLSSNVRLDITSAGKIGLTCAWENTSGQDPSVANVLINRSTTLNSWSTRPTLVRITDFVHLTSNPSSNYATHMVHGYFSSATGVNCNRNLYTTQYYALRNFIAVGTDDNGTIFGVTAARYSYGHFNTNPSADPQGSTVIGIHLNPFIRTGDLATLYDIQITTVGTGTGVITTAYYPIAQLNGDNVTGSAAGICRNHFNARTGFKTTDPQGVVEIEDGGTAYGQLLKITQDNEDVLGLIVGNDTYSTIDTNGVGIKLSNAGIGLTSYPTTLRVGAAANYSEFEADGTLKFSGDAVVWKDDNFDISTLGTALGDAPDVIALSSTNIEVVCFSGATLPLGGIEEVSGCREIQHDYLQGSNITPHIHWYPTTNDAGNVVWQLEYCIVRGGNVVGAATTITVTQAAGGVAWTQKRADWTAITGTGLQIGDQIHFRLFRDYNHASDTYEHDAAAATFGFHYQVDTVGSRTITAK